MVIIEYNENIENGIKVLFNGDAFDDLLFLVKENFFIYNPEDKCWYTNPKNFIDNDMVNNFSDYDDISIDKNILERIKKDSILQLEVRRRRFKINKDLILVPPLKGISPNENFQMEEIQRGLNTNRHYFALFMGLGKSYCMANIISQLWNVGKIDKVLIVARPEGTVNFKNELLRFCNCFNEDDIYIASAQKDRRKPFEKNTKVVIMAYHIFRIICEDAYKEKHKIKGQCPKFKKPVFDFDEMGWGTNRLIVLDEADSIGNHKSKQSNAIIRHKEFFDYRYELSGTPAENQLSKWYNQLRFLDPAILNNLSFQQWIPTIANMGRYIRGKLNKYLINSYHPKKFKHFKDTILTKYVSFRKTEDTLKLPENFIQKIYIELSDKQRELYKALSEYAIYTYRKENHNTLNMRKFVEQKFPFLSLALDNPCILKGKISEDSFKIYPLVKNWKFIDHSKLESTTSLLEKYLGEGYKVILWSGHPLTIDQLAEYYSKYNPYTLHGQTKVPKGITIDEYKNHIIDEFQEDKKRNLFIASYKVLKTSVNIVKVCRNIYFDRSYDINDWSQSIKRTHRYGQKQRVITNPLIFTNSLDIRLDKNIESKQIVNNAVFDKESFTVDEWKRIFEGKDI